MPEVATTRRGLVVGLAVATATLGLSAVLWLVFDVPLFVFFLPLVLPFLWRPRRRACPACGRVVRPSDARFCSSCGASVASAGDPRP